jgi:hypothetical protein
MCAMSRIDTLRASRGRRRTGGLCSRLGRGRVVATIVASVIAWLIVQTPRVATACAVCSAGRDDEDAAAFLLSTIFMSLTPLIAIFTIVYLLYRRIRKFEAEQEARRKANGMTESRSSTSRPPSTASSPVSVQ